ncbi:DUF397 domain-containing protein [Streptomyces sp. NPDC048255]|uniref:DUF397 domain-containing protein n=1 Tax=Streptomyces sp. NPDC048255 TaxID=3154713 RepID=UPI0033EE708E
MPEGGPHWRTSSYTGTETCVEVASDTPGCVMVRDTKRPDGGTITVGPSAWSSFVEYNKASPATGPCRRSRQPASGTG